MEYARRLNARDVAFAKSGCGLGAKIRDQGHQRGRAAIRNNGLADDITGVIGTLENRQLSDLKLRPGSGQRHFLGSHLRRIGVVEPRDVFVIALYGYPAGGNGVNSDALVRQFHGQRAGISDDGAFGSSIN